MADYYVIYNGTQYDVADFAAGVAKAKELGSSAVLYANTELTEAAHCDGVTTVFLAGGSVNIFGADSAITFQSGVYPSNTYGGGTHSSITVSGGTTGNIFAATTAGGGTSEIIVTGGYVGQIIASGKGGTLDTCNITVNGGQVGALQVVGEGGAVNNVTFTMSGNAQFTPSANLYLGGKGTLGNVTMNFLGGTIAKKAIFGTGSDTSAETRTGATVINIDNGFSNGTQIFGLGAVTPTASTINIINGGLFTNIFATSNVDTGCVYECPVTINFGGGTAAIISGGGSRNNTLKGDLTINFSGGLIAYTNNNNGHIFGTGFVANVLSNVGDTHVTVSGGTVQRHVCGGGNGNLTGNTFVTISGGTIEGYIAGGGRTGSVSGKATVNILAGANVGGVMGGGITVGAKVLGGTEVNVGAAQIHGELFGGAREGDTVNGDITLTVNGGTICRDRRDAIWRNGFIIGGSGHTAAEVTGNIAVSITNTIAEGNIIGGTFYGTHHGNVDLTISDTTVGNTSTGSVDGGSIFVVAYNNDEEGDGSAGTFTASLSNVTALGSLYQGNGGNYIDGDTAITVANSSFGGGIYLEYGDFTLDPDTGEVTESVETYINGDVAFSLTDVTVAGNVWGKGRFYDLAFFAEGKGATLAVAGTLTAGGEVAYFDTITLAAGATIAAGSVTASAITATASETQGLYTLATGFAAQACLVNVVNANGGTLGTVTLSDSVTSGTFTAGGLDYTVSVADNALKLQVGDDPGPTPPPPTPTATGAEVILTITDPNHDYYGATGGWKVQADQTVAWQDLTTLGAGYAYLGLGVTAAGKAMPDIYVYNADAKYIGAYVTDDTGAIADFTSIFLGESALMQVGIADFNADGISDLLLRTADGFVGYYANSTFAEVQGLGTEWTVAALGDVDGNGRADVIIAHEAGYVGAYLVGADGSISWADLGNLDSSTAIVGAGDVNGDGTDDVIVQVGANYFGAWLCGQGAVTGFFGIGEFDATVQDIADYNADGTDDLLFRTAGGVVGAALITGADTTTWAEYGALGAEWSTKGVGIL